jgi:hypothetical protein
MWVTNAILTAFPISMLLTVTAAAQTRFTRCGELVQGVECVLFQDDQNALFILDRFNGFAIGDRVRVTGVLRHDCTSSCQQGDGCVSVDSIEPSPEDGACDLPDGFPVCSGTSLALASLGLLGLRAARCTWR